MGISIIQSRYNREIIVKYGFDQYNGTRTPMMIDAEIQPRSENENPLSKSELSVYRQKIFELIYLSVCTRSDIDFSICYLD